MCNAERRLYQTEKIKTLESAPKEFYMDIQNRENVIAKIMIWPIEITTVTIEKPCTAVESPHFNLHEQVGKSRYAFYVLWHRPGGGRLIGHIPSKEPF